MVRNRLAPTKISIPRFPISVVAAAATLPGIILVMANTGNNLLLMFSCLLLLFGIANGWGILVEAPSRLATSAVILIVGITNLLLLQSSGDYSWCLVSAVMALPVSFIVEIICSRNPRHTAWSISCMLTGALLAICANSWILIDVYPFMKLLSWLVLPAIMAAILALLLPVKTPVLRLLACNLASIITAAPITHLYLSRFPELALILPTTKVNPLITIWILALILALFTGSTVAIATFLFLLPESQGHWFSKFILLLLPLVSAPLPIYTISRVIAG